MPPNEPSKMSSNFPEVQLVDYIRRLENHRMGRHAVQIHLSRLKPHNRREHHLRMAYNNFESQVTDLEGQTFHLYNNDLFYVFKAPNRDQVQTAIFKLKFVFRDDPLLNVPEEDAEGFVTWYNVERQYDQILRTAQRLVQDARAQDEADRAKAVEKTTAAEESAGTPMTSDLLGRVVEALARADLSNLMRRQSVAAIIGNAPPQAVFAELYVSIKDLRDTLLPDVDLTGNRWLFQHLTETLDRRMLSLLTKNDDASVFGDISINLNVSTLLSTDFLRFDDNVKAGMRGTIVVELQAIDIFSDLGAFGFARDFAHERGYRICVDGLTHLTIPFVSRERLGVDLLKINWHPSMPLFVRGPEGEEFRKLIKQIGETRIILCWCGDAGAIEFGQSLGITLYQGRQIEQMLNEETLARRSGSTRAGR
ncbi:MAG: hypothetical protein HY521_14175 [Proteobacteria bacterium]|nr:hypothetical protein [Pseudomonadota bacterium]